MLIDPTAPVSIWTLGALVVGALMGGIPLYISLRHARRESIDAQLKDSLRNLVLQLDEPIIKEKVRTIADPSVALIAAIKIHDDTPYVHRAAFERYPSTDVFNGALNTVRAEIAGVMTRLEAGDRQRLSDMQELRGLIKDATAERKAEMKELKENVARAIGKNES